jgi:mono/diheme cytochrome c family protein
MAGVSREFETYSALAQVPCSYLRSISKRTPGDWKMRILAVIGLLAIVVAIASAVFFFGGFHNVAASQEDPAIVKWALVKVRTNSIVRNAQDKAPAGLDDPAKVQAGARAFNDLGCVNCHGAPGAKWAKFSEGLHPDPPDLKEVTDTPPEQLFWVIKNGINMTGMPSFSAAGAKDEDIWAIVAYIKKIPGISEADYKAWTAPKQ